MGFVKGPVSLNPQGITNCMGQDAIADNIIYLAGSQDLLLVIIKSLEDLEELTELPGMNSRTTVWNWLTKAATSATFGKLGIRKLSSRMQALGLYCLSHDLHY